jgi:hypothetical protein
MLHSDIVPEHSCDSELIPLAEAPAYLPFVRCSSCGTEFTFEPDSDWVDRCASWDAKLMTESMVAAAVQWAGRDHEEN